MSGWNALVLVLACVGFAGLILFLRWLEGDGGGS